MAIDASIAQGGGTAGSAVVFAGATVVIALVALVVTGVPFLAQMGIGAAGAVAVAVLLSLTLRARPARRRRPARRSRQDVLRTICTTPRPARSRTLGARWIALVIRRRWLAIGAVTVALLALAAPALNMRLGLPDDGTAAPATTQRQAYDLLATGFGPGFNGPADRRRRPRRRRPTPQRAADATAARLRGLDDVATVAPPFLNERQEPRDHHRRPRQRPVVDRDEGPRQRHPRRRSSDPAADRRRAGRDRSDRDEHRHLPADV